MDKLKKVINFRLKHNFSSHQQMPAGIQMVIYSRFRWFISIRFILIECRSLDDFYLKNMFNLMEKIILNVQSVLFLKNGILVFAMEFHEYVFMNIFFK